MKPLSLSTIIAQSKAKGLSDKLTEGLRKVAYLHEVEIALFDQHPNLKNDNGYPTNFKVDNAYKYRLIDDETHAYLSLETPTEARLTRTGLRALRLKELGIEVY